MENKKETRETTKETTETTYSENRLEGRNVVLEALRSGRTIDKIYVLLGSHDGPIQSIVREAKKHDTIISYVSKERLNQMSDTGNHQGVIAVAASYEYSTVEAILEKAKEKGEPPFILVLDGIGILTIWEQSYVLRTRQAPME